jgi:hypothetical protein
MIKVIDANQGPFTHAVQPDKVLEDFLHGVVCERVQGSIFWEIYTDNLH